VDCTSSGLLQATAAESRVAAAAAAKAAVAGEPAHLAAARERLHARFVERWPAGTGSALFAASPARKSTQLGAAETVQLGRITDWVNSLNVPVIVAMAPTGRIEHVNLAWEQLCGFTLKDVVGQTAAILQGEGTDQHAAKSLMNGIRRNGQVGHATLLNYKKSGQGFWNDVSVVPIFGDWVPPVAVEDGNLSGMTVASANTSEHPLFYLGFLKESIVHNAPRT